MEVNISNNFKYLIVRTGYTARLLEHLDEIEDNIRARFDYVCTNKKNCKHCKDTSVLYIYDNCHGEGYHKCNGTKEERKYVRNSLDKKHKSGTIAIKCDNISKAFSIIQILMDCDYCGCFMIDSLMEMVLVNDILVVTFDCESG
jgi:hypothetical protein